LYEAGVYTELCGDMVVFRALGGMFLGPSVDLIFLGFAYFELPSELNGFRVSKPRDQQALEFVRAMPRQYREKSGEELCERVYAVESNGKRFHVFAAKCWAFEYSEPQRRSALGALNDLSKRDEYLERYVRAWYSVG
jgi:hypothetical protein